MLYNIRAVFVSHSTDGDEDPYLFIQLFSVQVEDYIEKKQKSSKSVYLCARYSNAMKQKNRLLLFSLNFVSVKRRRLYITNQMHLPLVVVVSFVIALRLWFITAPPRRRKHNFQGVKLECVVVKEVDGGGGWGKGKIFAAP